jgi:hypothetical protein
MVIDTLKMNLQNDLWLVTIDEIVNHRHICGMEIDYIVYNLFYTYEKLNYLVDEEREYYNMPIIAYSFCEKDKMDFISTFGIFMKNDIFGNFYYFTDYFKAIEEMKKNKYNGLIRCSLFLENTKIVLNLEDDPTDTSDFSLKLLKDKLSYNYNSDEYIKQKMMLRITDWDGNWSLLYDSLYIGELELDDGTKFEDGPLWVVKDYNHFIILSSQHIKIDEN